MAADSGMEEVPFSGGDFPDLEGHAEHVGDSGSQEELLSQLEILQREKETLQTEKETL